MTEDEMVGWHHRHDGHEFDYAPGVGDGQGRLVCCSPWVRKEWDTTKQLNWYILMIKNLWYTGHIFWCHHFSKSPSFKIKTSRIYFLSLHILFSGLSFFHKLNFVLSHHPRDLTSFDTHFCLPPESPWSWLFVITAISFPNLLPDLGALLEKLK